MDAEIERAVNYSLVRRRLKEFFGDFPKVIEVHCRLQALLDSGIGDFEPECLALLGETGTGKTRLLRRFIETHPPIVHNEHTEVPALYLAVPPRSSVKALASLLLKALGSKFWDRGHEVERTHQLLVLLRGCETRLIILDEVNHLADRGALKTHYHVGDWIKQLIGESHIPLVLAGTRSGESLVDANEQLADRFGERIYLRPFGVATESHRAEFAMVIDAFKTVLGRVKLMDLEGDMLMYFAFATGGRLRDIRGLLLQCVDLLEESKTGVITKDVLAAAFSRRIYVDAPPKRNPFHKDFDKFPLTRAGEPFAPKDARQRLGR